MLKKNYINWGNSWSKKFNLKKCLVFQFYSKWKKQRTTFKINRFQLNKEKPIGNKINEIYEANRK